MFEILEVRNDQTAVVSTAGLCRVIAPRRTKKGKLKQKVIGELLPLDEADAVADFYNESHHGSGKKGKLEADERARVVDYESVYMHCGRTYCADADITVYDRFRSGMGEDIARDVRTKSPHKKDEATA